VEATLAALRAAGYAPVAEDAAGTPVLDRLPRSRVPEAMTAPPTRPQPVDHLGLAKALLAKPAASNVIPLYRAPTHRARAATGTAHHLGRYADHLGTAERQLLAGAIDREEPVRIAYVDSGGQLTERVIEQMELDGVSIVAWCRLREDERRFLLRRVAAVSPA
jgi:predicted DNA-binding transcriptional regulator YafY